MLGFIVVLTIARSLTLSITSVFDSISFPLKLTLTDLHPSITWWLVIICPVLDTKKPVPDAAATILLSSGVDLGFLATVLLSINFYKATNNFVMSPLLALITDANSSFGVLAKLRPSIVKSLIKGLSGFFV